MAWNNIKEWFANMIPSADDFNRIEGNTLDNHERLNGHDLELFNHDSRILSNDSDIASINSTLSSHNSRISSNASDIANHNSRILSNDSEINKIKSGTTKVPKASNADNADYADNAAIAAKASTLLSGLRNVSVIMGTISNGNTLPLPSGFSESECFWIVSINSLDTHIYNNEQAPTRTRCYVDGSRTVYITATRSVDSETGTANYLVIGVK